MAVAEGSGRLDSLQQGRVTWVDVERPSPGDVAALGERFAFHPLDLDDLLSRTERPKLDVYERYVFAVLHFPVLLARPRRLVAGELHVFVGEEFCVTVHDGDLRPVRRLFEDLARDPVRRESEMATPGYLAYRILIELVTASAPITDRLASSIEALQEDIFGELSREPVREMAQLRRELIQLRRMVRADAAVVAALQRAPYASGESLAVYWDNAADQIRRLVDYLDDVWQTLEALSRSYEQLAAHRTNNVMRVLTVISTIMLPLAVISGIYGMNIRGLPWAESEWAFEITLGLMLGVVVGLLTTFRRRRWI